MTTEGLTEKYWRIYNFEPSLYNYDAGDRHESSPTLHPSSETITVPDEGLQQTPTLLAAVGPSPRLVSPGAPIFFNNKIVVRAVWACTTIAANSSRIFLLVSRRVWNPGGPFGVTIRPPFVNSQVCTHWDVFYEEIFHPDCDPSQPTAALL